VAAATVVPANQAPTEKKVPEGKPLEVIIEAKENVEIEYSSARTLPQKLLLKVDQIHTFKSRSGVRLKISNGGAVNVIVNGQDLGAPGAQGQSIQLNYE
jgi:cytoskeleton protein RodZ